MADENTLSAALNSVTLEATNEPAMPELLRLPQELRLQIYELLAAAKPFIFLSTINTNYISSCPPGLSITRVCKTLRNEAVPIFYAGLWLVIDVWKQSKNSRFAALDPFVFQCMRGFRILGAGHACRKPVSSPGYTDHYGLEEDATEVAWLKAGKYCCPVRLAVEKRGHYLTLKFAKEIEFNRRDTKEKLLELLKQMADVIVETQEDSELANGWDTDEKIRDAVRFGRSWS